MRVRISVIAIATLTLFAVACSDDDPVPGGSNDASATAPDADPNAPDANPNAPDANPNAPDANPNTPDATPGGGPDASLGIECGGATCAIGSQECCVSGGIGGQTQTCVDVGTCQDSTLSCDGPEDCTGSDVCCGTGSFGGGGGGVSTSCSADCSGAQSAVLCRTASDCPSASPMCCNSFVYTSDICRPTCGSF